MSPLPASIAELRVDRQVEIRGPHRRILWSTRADEALTWASWHALSHPADPALHSWPTWSHDGQRLACFRAPARGAGAELVVLREGGVRIDVLVQFAQELPIYLQWSPGGGHLAVLFQQGARLGLWVVRAEGGELRELGRGSPMFFTWADEEQIAVFHGRTGGARVGLFDVHSGAFHAFPGVPGNFCAPVRLAGRIAYVAHHEGRVATWLADRHAARELEPIQGLAALLPSPDGRHLARAIAPDERSPYRDLVLLDPLSGEAQTLCDGPLTAFLWSPAGDRLVLARTDPHSGVVTLSTLGLNTGIESPLGDLRPTRDLRFYLRFFEQFAQSHPLVDPAGEAIVVPGELARAGDTPGLWRLPLDGGTPERLGDGLLGVWAPAR